MKTALTLITIAGLAAIGTPQHAAVAKGPVAVIEFSGATLQQPIVVTQGDALLDFNPWGQQFLGERLDSAPESTGALTVTLFLDDASGERRAMYRFEYCPAPTGGHIYLPGPGEPDYDLNNRTILSANDGHWFETSPALAAFYENLINIQPPSTGSGGVK